VPICVVTTGQPVFYGVDSDLQATVPGTPINSKKITAASVMDFAFV
jgi:hypothetical protein